MLLVLLLTVVITNSKGQTLNQPPPRAVQTDTERLQLF
jgi:hypothetical protein